MKISRFFSTKLGAVRYGVRVQDEVHFLSSDFFLLHKEEPGVSTQTWDTSLRLSGGTSDLADCTLLPPSMPGKILCVGRNYAAHARELGHEIPSEPLLFFKPSSSLLAHGGTVELPPQSLRVEHEAELALVIGKRMKNVPKEEALSYVFGYTSALDMTARDIQKKDVQFTRGKGFDTFCPLGSSIETEFNPFDKKIVCKVNGVEKQQGNTKDMIWDVPTLLSYMSFSMSLEPGDVVLTGTPEGVSQVQSGDTVSVQIEGLEDLWVRIAS